MAVRQYIGARYVPAFYENSNNTSAWESGVAYEALTIVTYNGNSYTSKKPVPSTIGNPSANPTYWAQTGNFNAQLQEVVERFNNLPTVNPADYGAIGDGVTDDSAAIEEAAEYGVLYGEKNKTYRIASNIDIPYGAINCDFYLDKNVTISGGRFFFMCKFHKNASVLDDNTRGKWLLRIYNELNPYIGNCEFYNAVSSLYLDRVTNARVENNYFHDIIQTPTSVSLGGNGYGVLTVQSDNVHIENNYFKNVARHAVYISHDDESLQCENIFITHNTFKLTSAVSGNTTGFEYTIHIRPANNIIVSENLFEGTKQCVVTVRQKLVSTGYVEGVKNLKITNNIFKNIANSVRQSDGIVTNTYEGADTAESSVKEATNLVISHNFVDNCTVPFFRGASIDGLFIEGNTVTGRDGYYFINFADITEYRYPKDVHIRNNTAKSTLAFFRLNGSAITLDYLEISGNDIQCSAFFDFTAGHTITVLKLLNNNIVADSASVFSNGLIPGTVYAEGNSSNQRLSWNAVITDTVFYSWDNVFARISADDIDSTLRSGTIIATPQGHLIGIDAGGTAKQLV